jgi:lysophospholipase L1-like esterase
MRLPWQAVRGARMKTILCYGDSNSWGSATVPRPDGRYAPNERWPGVLARELGPGWRVVEEGLPGRTTVHPDPIEGSWLDGSAYLMPCLRTHRPIDVVALMLGTNDLKARFGVPPGDIARGIGTLLAIIRNAEAGRDGGMPQILVICPAPLRRAFGSRPDFEDMFLGGHEKSLGLAPLYAEVAEANGAAFLDAGRIMESSAFDGIHLDPEAHEALGRAVAEALRRL